MSGPAPGLRVWRGEGFPPKILSACIEAALLSVAGTGSPGATPWEPKFLDLHVGEAVL